MEQGDLEKDLDTLDLESVSGRSKQILQEVVWALVYGCGDAKLRAAYEIGMLTKSSAKRRSFLAAAGAIIPLVSMLSSPSVDAQDASMQALLNLAVRNERYAQHAHSLYFMRGFSFCWSLACTSCSFHVLSCFNVLL